MKKNRKNLRPISLLLLVMCLFTFSFNNASAFGSYESSKFQGSASTSDMTIAGEPVAVGAALGVMSLAVVASGVAFVLGVLDGINGSQIELLTDHELMFYNSNDFSEFDI
ncbi:hypothetical protein ACFOUP_18200 [Belliella kenyensis]|uniref:Uncharacterized protein n=1 Tax=Belliella kenyensis TaxID=1472724 RepID=A0ABV8ETJ4_9BACT|nr:hypothetical protein [Belliella kenyensis]MCH7402285.1 hypothetical protein [Belliella kenyensis]MDN3601802.1 hypothetical protein [Belliella kenyensis]